MSLENDLRQSCTYASIMVSVDLGRDANNRIKLAGSLADRFSGRLIGVAARNIIVPILSDGAVSVAAELIEAERNQALEELAEAETLFRLEAGTRRNIEFRSEVATPDAWVCEQARSADLVVVTGEATPGDAAGGMRVRAADLVMNLGRPLLMVPSHAEHISGKCVVLAWKDTREARRAVRDSLPFLKGADEVYVVAVGRNADEAGANDVSMHLRLHGVESNVVVRSTPEGTVADELATVARQNGADLLVSGAYGHSRMREWIFGGVTRDLLAGATLPCLLSH